MASVRKNLSSNGDSSNQAQRWWLRDLTAPKTHLELRLMNLSGRLQMARHWAIASQGLPEHLFYMVVQGRFIAEVSEREMQLVAGDLLWIEPGVPFSFRLDASSHLVVWRFRVDLQNQGREIRAPEPVCLVSPAKNCARWMEAIVDEADSREPWADARLRGLLVGLSTEIFRAKSIVSNGAGELTRMQKAHLLDLVIAASPRRLTVADLARAVQLSPDYFSRNFQRTLGCSPRRWLVEQRLQLAALRLLESNLRISEIAEEFGYPDVFSFSKQFKQILGRSPLAYRNWRG